jgi:hypothetical protein
MVACGPVPAREAKEAERPSAPPDASVVKLCHDVVYLDAMPACVHEVSAGGFYRIEYRGDRPVSVTTINGAGEPVEEDESRCARWDIAYARDEGREVTGESCFDRAGRKRRERVVDPEDRSLEHLLDGFGQPLPLPGSEATTIVRTRDARGAAITTTFRDRTGERVAGKDGAYEARFEVDENGQQTSRCIFDRHGEPMLDDRGIHCMVRKLEDGLTIGASFLGLNREPVASKDGVHGWEWELDARGFVVSTRHFDVKGATVVNRARGYASSRKEVDDFGRTRVERFFDAAGSPLANRLGCEAIESRYLGKTSLPTEITCMSADGEKRPTRGQYVASARRYNERGDLTEVRFLGASGELVRSQAGYAIVRVKVDQRGNERRFTYLDEDRRPAIDRGSGAHRIAYAYDDRDRRIKTTFFDEKGKMVDSSDGFARVVTERDAHGRITGNRYFDRHGAMLTLFSMEALCVPFDSQNDGKGPADRSQSAASAILAKARADIEKGMSVAEAYRVHLGVDHDGDAGLVNVNDAPSVVTEALAVGALTASYEGHSGLCFLRRTDRAEKELP